MQMCWAPKIRGPFCGAPTIRSVVCWACNLGPHFLETAKHPPKRAELYGVRGANQLLTKYLGAEGNLSMDLLVKLPISKAGLDVAHVCLETLSKHQAASYGLIVSPYSRYHFCFVICPYSMFVTVEAATWARAS